MGSNERWSTPSTMTSRHHFHSTVTQNCQNLTQFQRCNSVRVHSYAYVPHWKGLKHFIYIQYGCENQSKVVYSIGSTSTGSAPSRNRSVTSSVTSTQKMWTLAAPHLRKWLFFEPNFQDIILAPSRADWNTQRWNWGHLKKTGSILSVMQPL